MNSNSYYSLDVCQALCQVFSYTEFSQQYCELSAVIVPTLQIKRLRHKEVAQSHSSRKWQKWD